MASIRIPALRHITRHCSLPSFSPRTVIAATQQRRWAQVHDVRRFLATAHPSQAVVDKYRAKLEQKALSEGHESIDDLKTAYAEKITQLHRSDAVEFPEATIIPQAPNTPVTQPNRGRLPTSTIKGDGGEIGEIPQAPETSVKQPNAGKEPPFLEATETATIPQAPNTPVAQPNKDRQPPASAARSSDKPAIKGLDDILDLSKVRELPDKELTAIWRLRHANSPNNICAVVPATTYRAMEDAARSAPQFVLPVPHESQGAEIHFLQWTFDPPSRTSTVLFTQLAEFKVRGEFAQPHTTVTHHLDLIDDKGLVMMQGQTMDGRGVSPDQARWLVMSLQRFYGGWEGESQTDLTGERKERAEERRKLLDWFAKGDERFTVDKLLEEAERMG